MGKFTFSYLRSEYDRIPYAFKKNVADILEKSNAGPEAKALVEEICGAFAKAIEDICKYTQDQLQVK